MQMRARLTIVAALFAAGCGGRSVNVFGTVLDGRSADSVGLPDATIEMLDTLARPVLQADQTEFVTADADGGFSARAPAVQTLYARIDAPGYMPTSFTGVSGDVDFEVPATLQDECGCDVRIEGDVVPSFYGIEQPEYAEWEELFAGCPGAGGDGGVIIGQVRYFLFVEQDRFDDPEDSCVIDDTASSDCVRVDNSSVPVTVRNARVTAQPVDAAEDTITACYLDAAGAAYDPDATNAGVSQTFAIFGLSQARYTVVVRFDITDNAFTQSFYDVWVPEDGVVPRFPLWIEFPTF